MVNGLLKQLYNKESIHVLDVQKKQFVKMIAATKTKTFKHYVSDNRNSWRCIDGELTLKGAEEVLNDIKQMKVLTINKD